MTISSSTAPNPASNEFMHSARFGEIQSRIYEYILTKIEELGAEFGRWQRTQIEQFVNTEVSQYAIAQRLPLNENEKREIASTIIKELAGFGPLEDLLSDIHVEDILINGYKKIFVSRGGILTEEPSLFKDNAHVLRIVRRILAPLGRRLDESSPMVDARLPDGGRLNAIIEPLAVDGPSVSIRKFKKDPLRPEDLMGFGSFNAEMLHFLHYAVENRCNILISGGTSSGKTSLLNALAFFIRPAERIVTAEDTAELALNHPHVVRLEARQSGFDGSGEVTIRDLIRNCLRMRPDRVVVGEVRGAEIMDMLQAMSTGHDGSMATIHANSARECLHRLEMLAGFAGFQGSEESLRRQISSAIDFIIQIGRLPNGKRRVLSITEITGMSDNIIATQELFKYRALVDENGEEVDHWDSLGISPHTPKMSQFKRYVPPVEPIEPEQSASTTTPTTPKKEGGFWARKRS